MMQILALGGIRVLWLQWTNSQGLLSPVEKGTVQPLSKGERLHPWLDRLLLLFWAYYIEDGPHLLCFRRLQKTKERVLLIT